MKCILARWSVRSRAKPATKTCRASVKDANFLILRGNEMPEIKFKLKQYFDIQMPEGGELSMFQVEGAWNGLVCLQDEFERKLIIQNQPNLSESMGLLLGDTVNAKVVSGHPELLLELGLLGLEK